MKKTIFISLLVGIATIHSTFGQEYIKTKTLKEIPQTVKANVINFISDAEGYITWIGSIDDDKNAHGKGDLVFYKYNNKTKRHTKYYAYTSCEMKHGQFVSVAEFNNYTKGYTYTGTLTTTGVPNGQGTLKWDHHTFEKYHGDVKNGKPDGFGTAYYANGDSSVGNWQDGEMHGTFTHYYAQKQGKASSVTLNYVMGKAPEKEDYDKIAGMKVLSAYKVFLEKYPNGTYAPLIQEKVKINEYNDFFKPLTTPSNGKSIGRFYDIFIKEDWEMYFEIAYNALQLGIIYSEHDEWKGDRYRLYFPESGTLPVGKYSLIKRGNRFSLYQGAKLINTQTFSYYQESKYECLLYAWIGMSENTEKGATIMKILYKKLNDPSAEKEKCDFNNINKYDTTSIRTFMRTYPKSQYLSTVQEYWDNRMQQLEANAIKKAQRDQKKALAEQKRLEYINSLEVGDMICYIEETNKNETPFNFTNVPYYTMTVSCYVEDKKNEKFKLSVGDVNSTHGVLEKKIFVNGVHLTSNKIVWVDLTKDKHWLPCKE